MKTSEKFWIIIGYIVITVLLIHMKINPLFYFAKDSFWLPVAGVLLIGLGFVAGLLLLGALIGVLNDWLNEEQE